MIMSEKILEVKHLGKAFGSNQVLRDIDFSVSAGDVSCIIGPSGSGKSTLLRCLNMLETPSGGEINLNLITNIAPIISATPMIRHSGLWMKPAKM